MSTPAAEPLLELAAAAAAESEQRGELGSATVAALSDAGVFRALVPAGLGGLETHPRELRTMVEAIAAADGAAGWCAAIGATSGLAAGYLGRSAAARFFGDPGAIGAGAFAPRGTLRELGDGSCALDGHWSLVSGISHATSVGLGCIHPDRGPLYAIVAREAVEVIETWDSLGLRATASHDVEARAVEVPAEHVVALVGGTPTATGPLYSFPLFGLLAVAVSAVCTGIARGALADAVAAARARRPAGSSRTLAERGTTHERIATAEASLRAASAGLDAAIEAAWAAAAAGAPLGLEERLGLRLAATHAARTAVSVVDVAHGLGGAAALYRTSTLERRLRDVHTAAQHMIVAPGTLELAGRVILDPDAEASRL